MANEITISTNESDMRSMLIKLMGRGMLISQSVDGQFLLTLEDILDLITKISQRVRLQNHTKMSDFYAEFGFEDGSREAVPSFEALQFYRSVNPSLCNACKLSFAFLIDFESRGVEKQSVDVEITGNRIREGGKSLFLGDDIIFGKIEIRIEYTDVTWANDIKNLFEKYCETHVSRFRLRHKMAPLLSVRTLPLLIFPFAMVGALFLEMRSNRERIAEKLGDYLRDLPQSDQMAMILRKLDILIYKENDIKGVSDLVSFGLIALAIMAAIILLSMLVRNIPISAIVLSQESKKVYERTEGQRNRANRFFLVGLLASVAISVVSANVDRLITSFFSG